jgi:hypothetical protein
MDRYEYMHIPAKDILANIMEQYNLNPLVHHGHVLTEIQKGMYGLRQAGILAYSRLVQHLALSDYTPVKHTPGFFPSCHPSCHLLPRGQQLCHQVC